MASSDTDIDAPPAVENSAAAEGAGARSAEAAGGGAGGNGIEP